jgi:hypothetical protein
MFSFLYFFLWFMKLIIGPAINEIDQVFHFEFMKKVVSYLAGVSLLKNYFDLKIIKYDYQDNLDKSFFYFSIIFEKYL